MRALRDGRDRWSPLAGGWLSGRHRKDAEEATPFSAARRRLAERYESNTPSRCVNVVSAAIRMYNGNPFEDVQSEAGFIGAEAYGRSKLLNVLPTLALAKRIAAEQVTVNMVHPGVTWTHMTRSQTWRTNPSWR